MNELLSNSGFLKIWKTYTEYLLEDHGITLSPEEETERLKKLTKISKGNPYVASEILEILISRGETTIFEANENIGILRRNCGSTL